MRPKDLLWLSICLLILVFIYYGTNATKIFTLDPSLFLISFLLYFISIVFWIGAWIYLIKERFVPSFRLNMKALLGVFAPLGLGGDVIRTYFARTEKIEPAKALSASFVIKFYKFIIMFFFLVIAIYLLGANSADFSQYSLVFISMIFMIMGGAIFILMFRLPVFARLAYRILNRLFVFKFHEQLNRHFISIKLKDILVIVSLLVVSTLFEVGAVMYAFSSIGQGLLLTHVFIFAAVASSLALLTLTPQGIGFVEAGGYFVLSLGYFSLSKPVIGSFLIAWSIIRIWIPSLIGAIAFGWKR